MLNAWMVAMGLLIHIRVVVGLPSRVPVTIRWRG